jgi:SAM-dependent methyltransferase
MAELAAAFETDVREIAKEISQDREEDPLGQRHPEAYFASGQWAMRRIRLAMLAAGKVTASRILDLPSGYGRVLRVLRAAFPDAEVTACDIHRPAVDFCAQVLGALPVYGCEKPGETPLEGGYDLVWCGSLLTHLDEPDWDGFLDLFERVTTPGGVLVFTTLGRFVAEEHLMSSDNPYGVEHASQEMLRAYSKTGFGFGSYYHGELAEAKSLPSRYGIAIASPSWVCKQLGRRKFDLLTYSAGGWGERWGGYRQPLAGAAQDVIGCLRIAD